MKVMFAVTSTIVLLMQWMGLFASSERGSTDFLFTPTSEKSTRISLVAIDDRSLMTVGRWPWPRDTQAALLSAINTGKPAVIGYDIVVDDPTEPQADLRFTQTLANLGTVIIPGNAARVTVDIDGDGAVRRLPCADSFALAVVQKMTPGVRCLSNRLTINYRLGDYSLPVFSATDVLQGAAIPTSPIVLVGITSPSLQDMRRTPLTNALLPGVYIHANAVDTLVSGRVIRDVPKPVGLGVTMLLLTSFALMLWRVKYVWGLMALVLWGFMPVLITIAAYAKGWRIGFWYMEIGLAATYVTQLSAEYLMEWRRRRFVTKAFGKYVSPEIVKNLIAHPDRLTLGGETRRISVFFSDIRSFTTISERMEPKALVALLNAFLTFATDNILGLDGTVDKYIGDAIVAFWNAPVDQTDHAVRSAKAAIAIRDGMNRFDKLVIGVGLHTGDALVGNVGSSDRLSYTAIGDTVNTASRLEGITKQYGVPIVVSQSFYDEVHRVDREALIFRKLDTVIVKGKKTPLVIYELVGLRGSMDRLTDQRITQYAAGLALYERGSFREARKALAHECLVGDTPARVLIDRCQFFIKQPPRPWNGVTELLSK